MAAYDIRKVDGQYHVYDQVTGEDKGKSVSRGKAEAAMRSLYALSSVQASSPGVKADGPVPSYLDDTYTPRPIEQVWRDGVPVAVTPPAEK